MSLDSKWGSRFSIADYQRRGLLPSVRRIAFELSRYRFRTLLNVSNLVELEGRRQPTANSFRRCRYRAATPPTSAVVCASRRSTGRGLRYSNGPRAAGSRGCSDDGDPHARTQSWRSRCAKSRRRPWLAAEASETMLATSKHPSERCQ